MKKYLPPEWAEQSGVMLTWPHSQTIWADTLSAIDKVFTDVASAIARREKVIITAYDDAHQAHIEQCLNNAGVSKTQTQIYQAPCDDIWVRDHGPITVRVQEKPRLLDFIFNGWGHKYACDNDDQITRRLHQQQAFGDTGIETVNMVLEGGALEVDDGGTLLTTRSCLLAQTRNPSLSENDIAEQLQTYLGIKKILWLDQGGLAGDDTDGHIDTLARFVNSDTICYVSCDDKNDEHYIALKRMQDQLATFTNVNGKPYQLLPLPWPKARYAQVDGRRLPATYANFLIINGAILVPTYDDPADEAAMTVLAAAFPTREIIGINCCALVEWYGSLHCMTMQLPRGVI